MPARIGCCKYNLVKMDPSTGAIIWKKMIRGDGSDPLPCVGQVRRIPGTNDVLVACTAYKSGSPATYCNVVRVDPNGSEIWYYNGQNVYTGVAPGPYAGIAQATVGVPTLAVVNSGGNGSILFGSQTGVRYTSSRNGATSTLASAWLLVLDYSGNLIWADFPPVGAGTGIFQRALGSPYTFVYQERFIWNIDINTYAWNIGPWGSPTGSMSPSAIDLTSSVGGVTTKHYGPAAPPTGGYAGVVKGKTGGSTFDYLAIEPVTQTTEFAMSRFLASGGLVSDGGGALSDSSQALYDITYGVCAANGSTTGGVSRRWTTTTGGGTEIADTFVDSTGAYYSGYKNDPVSGDGSMVQKRDLTYGNLLWLQYFAYDNNTINRVLGRPYAVSMDASDEGYLYVGGRPRL